MTQKEKMIGGKLYLAYDEELIRERLHAQSLCFELNQLPPKELAQRTLPQTLWQHWGGFLYGNPIPL